MNRQISKIKMGALFGCLFVLLLNIIYPVLSIKTINAQGSVSGSFIDRHIIRIMRGDNETLFKDVNPYDDDRGYEGGPVSCRHDLDIENWDRGEISIQFKEKDSTDECVDDGDRVDITLSDSDRKVINAYRIDANNIFTPVTLNRDDPNCGATVTGSVTTNNFINHGDIQSGNWQRKPPDERDAQNQYFRDDGDSLYGKMRIETSPGGDNHDTGKFVITYNTCVGTQTTSDFADGEDFSSIWITERPIPSVYDEDGDGTPDDNPDGGGGGGTADDGGPTCEEANNNIAVTWLVCSLVQFMDDAVMELSDFVDELLIIDEDRYSAPELKEAWSYFRNIASFMLIIIGLVMVIGQAVSKE